MKDAGYEHGIKGLDFLVRDISPHTATVPMVQDLLGVSSRNGQNRTLSL